MTRGCVRGRIRATIRRPETVAIQIKSPQREEKGGSKECGNKGYTDQGAAEGGEGQR